MRTEPLILHEPLHIVRIYHRWFQRTETDAEFSRQSIDSANDDFNAGHASSLFFRRQRPCEALFCTIQCRIDTSQNHLFESGCHQCTGFLHHFLRIAAPHMAPGKRNQAVSTEPVAAFLNLDVGTGSGLHGCDDAPVGVLCQFIVGPDVKLFLPVLPELFHIGQKVVFFTGTCHNIHFLHGSQFFRTHLGIAAGHCYDGLRRLLLHAADVLAGLAVCQICYGTCIDDIYVCKIFFADNFMACSTELFLHGFRFVLIDFAA